MSVFRKVINTSWISRHKRNSRHKLASQKPSSDFNLVPQPMISTLRHQTRVTQKWFVTKPLRQYSRRGEAISSRAARDGTRDNQADGGARASCQQARPHSGSAYRKRGKENPPPYNPPIRKDPKTRVCACARRSRGRPPLRRVLGRIPEVVSAQGRQEQVQGQVRRAHGQVGESRSASCGDPRRSRSRGSSATEPRQHPGAQPPHPQPNRLAPSG